MNSEKTLLIASGNRSKAGEIKEILEAGLSDLGVAIVLWADFPNVPDVDENGSTYAENAAIKSKAGAAATGLISLGDDVGLEVEALDGQPGLYSRRFAGEQTPFSEKMRIILEKLEGLPDEKRAARFMAAVAITVPNGETRVFQADRQGRIGLEPKGQGGFGYDPIFFLPDRGCTMAELPREEKNRTSHRARVLADAMPYLRSLFGG